MTEKKASLFANLSWDDLKDWAGNKIVSRGKDYQHQKLVSKLAMFENGDLIAWVDGTHRYATRVTIGEDNLPESTCTCPYGHNCKHGVAVVLEYLDQIQKNKKIPKAAKDDERLLRLEENEYNDDFYDNDDDNEDDYQYEKESLTTKKKKNEITALLKDKTREELSSLILELAEKFPAMAQELIDRQQLVSGDTKSLIHRLKKEIRVISSQIGWQNYWDHEGYTPDYSQIRIKLEILLKAGHPDEVLKLGKELIESGRQQLEESHDEGETATEIEECMPILVKALEQSSMAPADKLAWAVEVVLKDDYDVFNTFDKYLGRKHAKADWDILADRLLKQLGEMKHACSKNDFHLNHVRDNLSGWVIYALKQACRNNEIIPLCEAEARKTYSYKRLVEYLLSQKRYQDAERWIQEGIVKTEKEWPGIASGLRNSLKEIRTAQNDWIAVATMQAEEFVCYSSEETFLACQKVNAKTKTWPKVRELLLLYLENGQLPWKQKDWPLAKSDQVQPDRLYRNTFPMTDILIDIAIQEKQLDRVLFWYDQSQSRNCNWTGDGDDRIAAAIETHVPQRSVAIWKTIAENLINQANTGVYDHAVRFLRKAEKTMNRMGKQSEWDNYLNTLKEKHAKKRRFIEILNQSDGKPIIQRKR